MLSTLDKNAFVHDLRQYIELLIEKSVAENTTDRTSNRTINRAVALGQTSSLFVNFTKQIHDFVDVLDSYGKRRLCTVLQCLEKMAWSDFKEFDAWSLCNVTGLACSRVLMLNNNMCIDILYKKFAYSLWTLLHVREIETEFLAYFVENFSTAAKGVSLTEKYLSLCQDSGRFDVYYECYNVVQSTFLQTQAVLTNSKDSRQEDQ